MLFFAGHIAAAELLNLCEWCVFSQNESKAQHVFVVWCSLQVLQDEQDLREEQRKKKDGLFQRTGRFCRSTSPPSRNLSLSLSRHHDSTLPCLDPSPSVTLLSLSSLSDCNSTKSLLPSDPDDYPLTPMAGVRTPAAPPAPALNPLLDLRAESFKKEPNQSLTPTHVSAAMAMNRGHRRTPSDGAIRPRAQTLGHHRTPSDGSMPMPPPPHITTNKGTGLKSSLTCHQNRSILLIPGIKVLKSKC